MTAEASSGAGRLPDFLVIGAARSGTTTLYEYLRQHPGIYMPTVKEPCFFDEAMTWNRGFAWYRGLFEPAEKRQICGEASTNYTRWPQVAGVPEKIKAVMPDVKLVYLLRDPVERAYSHYVFRWSRELHKGEPVRMGFMEFVQHEPMCIDSSKYSLQIRQYLAHFPREQLLLIVFEDLVKDPDRVMGKVFRFLGLDPIAITPDREVKANSSDESLDVKVKTMVAESYKHNPLYRLARWILPRGVKDYLSKVYLPRSEPYRKAKSAMYSFPPLTQEEAEQLYSLFAPFNKELQDLHGIDVSRWTLKLS